MLFTSTNAGALSEIGRANREAPRAELGFDVTEAGVDPRRMEKLRAATRERMFERPGFNSLPGTLPSQLARLAAALSPEAAKKVLDDGLESFNPRPRVGAIAPPRMSVDEAVRRQGVGKLQEAVAVSGMREAARAVKDRRVVGRDIAPSFAAAFEPFFGADASDAKRGGKVREAVAITQGVTNEALGRAGLTDRLKIDGDFGPKTTEAVSRALDSAGPERFTDEVAKRMEIGPTSLLDDDRRGFLLG